MMRRLMPGSKLVRRGELHEFIVEAQFDVALIPQNLAARKLDADDIHRRRTLPQQSVIEGKFGADSMVLSKSPPSAKAEASVGS